MCTSLVAAQSLRPDHPVKIFFGNHRNAELPGLIELAACFFTREDEVGLFADTPAGASTMLLNQGFDLVSLILFQRAGHDDRLAGERQIRSSLVFHNLLVRIDADSFQARNGL